MSVPQPVAGPSRTSAELKTSPILHRTPMMPMSPEQPQFAELLTPAKLRRKRRHAPQIIMPSGLASTQAGPSQSGYYTLEGDLFRGAVTDPTIPIMAQLDEDALTLGDGSSTTSSGSSWSWQSDLERGRKRTMAVIERFGEAIGVRRGSNSSGSSDAGTNRETRSRRSTSRNRRMSRRLSRSMSRRSSNSSIERPKREYLPRRREFTLLVPPLEEDIASAAPSISLTPRHSSSIDRASPPADGVTYPLPVSERITTTPSLPGVLEKIKVLRLASGMASELPTTSNTQVRRGGSAPGHKRASGARGMPSFTAPPVPRPSTSRVQSRVDILKQTAATEVPIRPKSVADLIGLAKPASTTSLSSMKPEMPSMKHSVSSLDVVPRVEYRQPACWWLDVSCPTWEDLRDIGELLGLHPLTLEDVLQQDPREKLDFFERLGYYFIVVRALDEQYFKYTPDSGTHPGQIQMSPETQSPTNSPDVIAQTAMKKEGRRRGWGMGRAAGKVANKNGEKVEIVEDNPGKEGLEGVGVGGVNVYLVVFADGVVSFHFEDISKHTKRVLNRIITEAGSLHHTSDWVAHGILDSIVDAFFPLIRYVDGEVDDIDSLTIDPSVDPKAPSASHDSAASTNFPRSSSEEFEMDEKVSVSTDEKAVKQWRTPLSKADFIKPSGRSPIQLVKQAGNLIPSFHIRLPLFFLYVKLLYLPVTSAAKTKHEEVAESLIDRGTMLRRMTDTRKLVSGLSRLLGAKYQVITRLRKRAADRGGNVEAYIGDIEDHVLLLQTSLLHYEYILAHCQPAYLSQLQASFSFSRGRTDKAILALSIVSISILPKMVVIGMFSMNVSIPHNGLLANPHLEPDGSQSPFNYFFGILGFLVVVLTSMMLVIRYWRFQARAKFAMKRGKDLPSDWDVFWGWK